MKEISASSAKKAKELLKQMSMEESYINCQAA